MGKRRINWLYLILLFNSVIESWLVKLKEHFNRSSKPLWKSILFWFVMLSVILVKVTSAEIPFSGDIDPTNPAGWTTSTNAYVGKSAEGTLCVLGSSIVSQSGTVGYMSGVRGTVLLKGYPSSWRISDWMAIGDSGDGTLNITNAGLVTTGGVGYVGYYSGGVGRIFVDGYYTRLQVASQLLLGVYGQGALEITRGGNVRAEDWFAIGVLSNENNTALISGAGSKLEANGGLVVGWKGKGSMSICDGGTVISKGAVAIANMIEDSSGVANVDGEGSTLTIIPAISNDGTTMKLLTVAHAGTGTLNITNGGIVSNGECQMAYRANSSATVKVDGAGSEWINTEKLSVGHSGNATLDITNGGSVSVGGDMSIGLQADGSGVCKLESGSLNISGNIVNGEGDSSLILDGGTLSVGGGSIAADKLYVGYAAGSNALFGMTVETINAEDFIVGKAGKGTFIQNHGTLTLADSLHIGQESGGDGTYELSGTGQLNVSEYIWIGSYGSEGRGALKQNSGYIHSSYMLRISKNSSYEINGGDCVLESFLDVRGEVNQAGGIIRIDERNALIAGNPAGLYIHSGGKYNVSGGSLITSNLILGVYEEGALNITDARANITISNKLSFDSQSIFTAIPWTTIHMNDSGFDEGLTDFGIEIKSTNPDNLEDLINLKLIFEGGTNALYELEVAGEDRGNVLTGFDSNFAFAALQIGSDSDIGKVQLVNHFDNQPNWTGTEALYVKYLILEADSSLDLNGFNLYYTKLIDFGGTITLNGGSLVQVPEPVTISIFALSSLVLLKRQRRRET